MAEPVVEPVVAPVVEPVVAPVVASTEPTNFFGTDGVLNEGWRGTLEEELREDKSLLSFKTVGALAKSFVTTKKMVGQNVIAIPGETSTEGEWQEYHKAGGRPETVADYNLKAPDGFPEDALEKVFPKARLEAWQERFFKGGVSKNAADHFLAEFANDMVADYKLSEQSKEQRKIELDTTLHTDWGAAYQQKEHLAGIALEEGCKGESEDFLAEAKQELDTNPKFKRLLGNLGKEFAEGKPPGFAAIPTPDDYQDQIDALMANPLYSKGTQQERMKIANKIMAIRKLQKPEPATT